ncbi:MAG: hypothetical protein AABY85_13510, partial [Gemmatimonadota bacterium]
MPRYSLILLGAICVARPVLAQCPDGTPPPCATRARAARVTPPAAERGRRFLVLPFRNLSRNPEHDWLVEGSTTMLAEALSRWQDLSVVSDERLYPALRRAGLTPGAVMDPVPVRRVADETGGWTVVNGEVLAWPWVSERIARWREAVAERQRRFRPLSVTVTEQELVVEWVVSDSTPFTWNRPSTRPGQAEYSWTVSYTLRGRLGGWVLRNTRAIDAPERSGTLAELVADAGRYVDASPRVAPGRLTIARAEPDLEHASQEPAHAVLQQKPS